MSLETISYFPLYIFAISLAFFPLSKIKQVKKLHKKLDQYLDNPFKFPGK